MAQRQRRLSILFGPQCSLLCHLWLSGSNGALSVSGDWKHMWDLWQALLGESQCQLSVFWEKNSGFFLKWLFLLSKVFGLFLGHGRSQMPIKKVRLPCSLSCLSGACCYFDPSSHQVRSPKDPVTLETLNIQEDRLTCPVGVSLLLSLANPLLIQWVVDTWTT